MKDCGSFPLGAVVHRYRFQFVTAFTSRALLVESVLMFVWSSSVCTSMYWLNDESKVTRFVVQGTSNFENYGVGTTKLIGTLLFFLVTFRSSQAYARWWEARMQWGVVNNTSSHWTNSL